MPSYQSPGVYIREVSSGVKPISSVGTSTGAFIGIAEKGPANEAVFIANWTQFKQTFGSFLPHARLAYLVRGFFQEGGSSCYVVRVMSEEAKKASITIPAQAGEGEEGGEVLRVVADSEGKWGNRVTVVIEDPADKSPETHFNLTVRFQEEDDFKTEYKDVDVITEKYSDFTLAPERDKAGEPKRDEQGNIIYSDVPRVNGDELGDNASAFIRLEVLDFNKRPANGEYVLAGGDDGGLDDPDYIKGLSALDKVNEMLLVAIPDKAGDREVIISTLAYCEAREDCFFVADAPHSADPTHVRDFKKGTGPYEGTPSFNSSYGALYYPWIYISDPLTGRKKLVPPSVLVAGVIAFSDNKRGVHKAPAGTDVGRLKTAIGVERIIVKSEHDILHPATIDVIRLIPNAGACVWGASTLSADAEWKYINIRRLFIMLRKSIYQATQWVVFEPNDQVLWGKVRRNITAYLTGVWKTGALVGGSQAEAFFVKVDSENNPQSAIDRGELHIDIGVAPVKPAEFVIFTIRQKSPSE